MVLFGIYGLYKITTNSTIWVYFHYKKWMKLRVSHLTFNNQHPDLYLVFRRPWSPDFHYYGLNDSFSPLDLRLGPGFLKSTVLQFFCYPKSPQIINFGYIANVAEKVRYGFPKPHCSGLRVYYLNSIVNNFQHGVGIAIKSCH